MSLRNVLISMGATDPTNATTVALRGLDACSADLQISVVLGRSAPHISDVSDIAVAMGNNVRVHVDPDDMPSLIGNADLAIGAAGLSSWERCCLGLPTLLVVLAENQAGIAAALEKAGACFVLGSHPGVRPETVTEAMQSLIALPEKRALMAARAADVCDGAGAERVSEVLRP